MRVYYNEFDPFAAAWLRELMKAGLIPEGYIDTRSIVDVQPDDLKDFTQCHFFAGIGGWAYALELAKWGDRPVWTGSCPCFAEGTRILTRSGLKSIQHLSVGEEVLTHKNRWRKVTQIGSEYSETIEVKGQGHWGIVTTRDHPFYCDGDQWVTAENLIGRKWRSPILSEEYTVPKWSKKGVSLERNAWRAAGSKHDKTVYLGRYRTSEEAECARMTAGAEGKISIRGAELAQPESLAFAEFLGYWVGDGWVTGDRVVVCGGNAKTEYMGDMLSKAHLPFTSSWDGAVHKKYFQDKNLAKWLSDNFGKGAANKKIPLWLIGQRKDYREAFLQGYIKADGSERDNSFSWTTVSKDLTLGLKLLLNSLLKPVSIIKVKTPDKTFILGREVNQRDYYRITSGKTDSQWDFATGYGESKVKEIKQWVYQRVYNIAVEEDESYVADGIIVHNCQPFSSAGKQKGKNDDRHLWPHWFRLIKECRPDTIFAEQVGSAIAFGWLDDAFNDLEAEGYACGASVLPACCVGAPHKRDRLWFVGDSQGIRGGERFTDTSGGITGSAAGKISIGQYASDGSMGNPDITGLQGQRGLEQQHDPQGRETPQRHHWSSGVYINCPDGKSRLVEPTIPLLSDGLPNRVGVLRGIGNAIVPPLAAEFISAFMEIENE